jgi:hypothetical protein
VKLVGMCGAARMWAADATMAAGAETTITALAAHLPSTLAGWRELAQTVDHAARFRDAKALGAALSRLIAECDRGGY